MYDLPQLSVCGMAGTHRGKKRYSKCTPFVDVRVKKSAHYDDVARISKVDIGLQDKEIGMLSLFRSDGTVIPDKSTFDEQWAICGYLKSLKKSCSHIKLGVGYLMKVYFATVIASWK